MTLDCFLSVGSFVFAALVSPLTFPPSSAFVSLPLRFTEDGEKGERCRFLFPLIFCLPLSTSRLISFPFTFSASCCRSLCILFPFMVQLAPTYLSLSSVLLFHFSLISSPHIRIDLPHLFSPPPPPVTLVPCFNSPCCPLSGVFQTFGACQEPPGVARLSPPVTPIRSDAGTQSSVSSQQQLQDDELAAGLLNFLSR